METKNYAAIYKRGLPYEPDVRKLEETFPSPEEGRVITNDELKSVLGLDRVEGRLNAVVNSWRKRMMRQGIHMQWVPGIGLEILSPAQAQEAVRKRMGKSERQLNRGIEQHSFVDRSRLDTVRQKVFDNETIAYAKRKLIFRETNKDLAIGCPKVISLPRPKNAAAK